MSSSLIENFLNMKDLRILKKCNHLLIDILVITVCASLCRFDESWESIEDFAHLKKDWLQKFLKLPNGIPSYDTILRVFLLLNPVEFQDCLRIDQLEKKEKVTHLLTVWFSSILH